MKQAIQFGLRMYQRCISPWLPHSCRFVPTCSEYALQAIEQQGALRGSLLAAGRLLRCHPLARAGYDPPPNNLADANCPKAPVSVPRETAKLSSAGMNGGRHGTEPKFG